MTTINAASGATPTPRSGAALPPDAAERFLEQARRFVGQPYRWGGGHTTETFTEPRPVDCSGLVMQAARMAGFNLDGTAAVQQRLGRPVKLSELQPGDLVFKGRPAFHVGIYVGDGQVLHAPQRGEPVELTRVEGFSSARRVFPSPAQPAAGAAPAAGRPMGTDRLELSGAARARSASQPQPPG
jgi:cell wall-associated NlpC family hydrolase